MWRSETAREVNRPSPWLVEPVRFAKNWESAKCKSRSHIAGATQRPSRSLSATIDRAAHPTAWIGRFKTTASKAGEPVSRNFRVKTGLKRVGARRFELRTSSLSATRSNQLSYAPGKEVPYSKSGHPAVKGPSMVFNRLKTGSQASKAGIFSRFKPANNPPEN